MKKEPRLFRVGDLSNLTGVSRGTIHFYVRTGLLHPPVKTGKTMAYYDESHVRKLVHIQKAKGQGLPLRSIREQIKELEKKNNIFGKGKREELLLKKRMQDRRKDPHSVRGKKTREKILEVGSHFFREKGYKDTKVGDITKQLGIGKGSFYFYFSDKKDLFLECVPRIFNDLFSKGWEKVREERDPLRRIELRIECVLPVIHEFSTILQISREALEDEDPKLKQLGKQIFASVCRPAESDIRRGIQQGIFRPIDARTFSFLLTGVMQYIDYLLLYDPQFSKETLKDIVTDMFRRVVKKTE